MRILTRGQGTAMTERAREQSGVMKSRGAENSMEGKRKRRGRE
jgi:hypothetical protein